MKKQFKVFISFLQNGKINKSSKKNEKRNQTAKKKTKKTASSPCQDLHPDWDRFRGTMLYPLSCGELAMKGEQNFKTTGGQSTAMNKGKDSKESVF